MATFTLRRPQSTNKLNSTSKERHTRSLSKASSKVFSGLFGWHVKSSEKSYSVDNFQPLSLSLPHSDFFAAHDSESSDSDTSKIDGLRVKPLPRTPSVAGDKSRVRTVAPIAIPSTTTILAVQSDLDVSEVGQLVDSPLPDDGENKDDENSLEQFIDTVEVVKTAMSSLRSAFSPAAKSLEAALQSTQTVQNVETKLHGFFEGIPVVMGALDSVAKLYPFIGGEMSRKNGVLSDLG